MYELIASSKPPRRPTHEPEANQQLLHQHQHQHSTHTDTGNNKVLICTLISDTQRKFRNCLTIFLLFYPCRFSSNLSIVHSSAGLLCIAPCVHCCVSAFRCQPFVPSVDIGIRLAFTSLNYLRKNIIFLIVSCLNLRGGKRIGVLTPL